MVKAAVLGKSALAHVLSHAGEELNLLMATRALWAFVLVLWLSCRFDASLVLLFVSCVSGVALFPVFDKILLSFGPFLPGVTQRLDLNLFFSSLLESLQLDPQTFLSLGDLGKALFSSSTLLVSIVLGWLISKRSPVGGLIVYTLTVILNAQSGWLDEYPVRLLVPVALVLASIYSRHIRYLNLASAVFAALMIASEETTVVEVKDLTPKALWFGFALLVMHDLLVRMGVVEWMALVAESVVLVFTFFNLMQMVATEVYEVKISLFEVDPLEWMQIMKADCLPECVQRFEVALPGVFCTFFCVVTILRNIVGGKCGILKTLLSCFVVVGVTLGGLIASEKFFLVHNPNVTAVIAALALIVSERFSARKDGFASKGSALVPRTTGIDYHILIYWQTKPSSRDERSAKESSGKRTGVSFSDDVQVLEGSKKDTAVVTEKQVEDQWRLVEYDSRELAKVRKTHKTYKGALFQQEALLKGLGANDPRLEKEKKKAESMAEKLRQLSSNVQAREKQVKQATELAKKYEQLLQEQSKKQQ